MRLRFLASFKVLQSRKPIVPRKSLNFTIRPVQSEAELRAACSVRSSAYGRHLPNVTPLWGEPDPLDRCPGSTVYVATEKSGGRTVGTIRLRTNAAEPTQIEQSASLPEEIAGTPIAELTRFAVLPGHDDPAVGLGLMKAAYLHCLAHQIHWMVIGARSPALARQYRRLGFTDVAGGRMVPLAYAAGLPHHVLALDVVSVERNWFALRHPFYAFMVRTHHPDIQPFARQVAIAAAA